MAEIKKDPLATNYEIGQKLKEKQIVSDVSYPYQATRYNKDIVDKIAKLRERYEQKLLKKTPKAIKVVDNHLNSNNLDAAKVVLKHALPVGRDDLPNVPIQINIGQLQQVIKQELTRDN